MKTICNRLIVVSIVLFVLVSLVSSAEQSGGDQAMASGSHRSKRRVEDVEKLMRQDHLMALLICDLCVDNACALDYCIYCHDCAEPQPASSSENELAQFGPKSGK